MTSAELWAAWRLWMVVAVVIILLAAALLITIWLTARSIAAHASRALKAVETIRDNTRVIWALQTTNEVAEQIRGTGQFALRHDGEESLHAAMVRALDEVARRRISGYENLSAKERASAISRLTSYDRNSIATAVHNPRSSRFQELPATISLLEATRRTLVEQTRAHHGRR